MNQSNPEESPLADRVTVESLTELLLKRVPDSVSEMLLRGALPHWLDESVAAVLFSDLIDPPLAPSEVLTTLQAFRFVVEAAPGQLAYHRQVREYILGVWATAYPDRFRTLSARLAEYYYSLSTQAATNMAILPEYLYHLLVADPGAGVRDLGRLFESAMDAHELGLAERLISMAQERRVAFAHLADWINYCRLRLGLAQYDMESSLSGLSKLADDSPDALLAAIARRALGQGLVHYKRWSEGITSLQDAITAFARLHDDENVARTQVVLGDAYRSLAEDSGGIYEEGREFSGRLHRLFYTVANLPILFYRKLADTVDAIPKLYGTNYQNWIVLRLLHNAASVYRKAEQTAQATDNERLNVEVQQRLADVEWELGRYRGAEERYRSLSIHPLVQSGPHRSARVALGMARLALLRHEQTAALNYLRDSFSTFTQMRDWRLAAEAGYLLGQVYEDEHMLAAAIDAYSTAVEHAGRARDSLLRTEIASALSSLLESPIARQLDGQAIQRARTTVAEIDEWVFINRFPGRIHVWFAAISRFLAGPILFIVALFLALLSGVTLIIMEGALRNLASVRPVPLGLTDSIIVILTALVPFFALWIRHLLYVLIGIFVVRVLLSIARIERSKPQVFVLTRSGIMVHGGSMSRPQTIAWQDVNTFIKADRTIWQNPTPLLSRTIVMAGEQRMELSGTTNLYQEMQSAIEAYLRKASPDVQAATECSYAVVRHWWLWAALALAGGLAAYLVFVVGVYSIYCATPSVSGRCPDPIRLVVAPWAMWTNIFVVVIFAFGTLVRSINASFCVHRSIRQAQKMSNNT